MNKRQTEMCEVMGVVSFLSFTMKDTIRKVPKTQNQMPDWDHMVWLHCEEEQRPINHLTKRNGKKNGRNG